MDKNYCYAQNDVLVNNFNIQDANKLKEIERVLTAARLLELYKKPIIGRFDLIHLKKIHYHIFQDIYPWAGKLRLVDIAKGYTFCHVAYIEKELNKLFKKLEQDEFLQLLSGDKLITKAAYYFGEINAIHPFRDGNGRTQREFLRELLLNCGYKLDYTAFAPHEMIAASISSFGGNNTLLESLLSKAIKKL